MTGNANACDFPIVFPFRVLREFGKGAGSTAQIGRKYVGVVDECRRVAGEDNLAVF
jgi:hypothetical protein